MVAGMVVEALLVMVVVGIVDARLERLVEWDGTTPQSAALLGVMVLVAETAGRPIEAKE